MFSAFFPGEVMASGHLPAGTVAAPDARSTADRLVREMFGAYQYFNRPAFEDRVSDDFRPLRTQFVSDVHNSARSGMVLEMHYVLNEVWTKKDKLIAAVKWEKKSYPAGAKAPVLRRGQARMVFVDQNGAWKLQQVGGNNPF